jgi:hypothetical protein
MSSGPHPPFESPSIPSAELTLRLFALKLKFSALCEATLQSVIWRYIISYDRHGSNLSSTEAKIFPYVRIYQWNVLLSYIWH